MPARHTVRRVGGRPVHTLANDRVSISVAPDFGARVVSLRDLASGREWLEGWSPASARRFHAPADPADYMTSPQAGIDECLPTITRGRVAGRDLPDHGETWNLPAPVDLEAAARGEIVSKWSLRCLPLDFSRRISLSGSTVRLAYALTNRARRATPFLWAWHPLFTLRPGDVAEAPASVRKVVFRRGDARPWPQAMPGCDLSRGDLAASGRRTFKGFLGPLSLGAFRLRAKNGALLDLRWPAEVFPYVGYYVNRGRHTHWAIEPTNGRSDSLERLVAEGDRSPLVWLAPGETREWFVTARVGRLREPGAASA